MLTRLHLRDFVIVRELEMDMRSGYTALTGETGAGKSILIEALQWVLGARSDSLLVREGAARAEIVAEFEASAAAIRWLNDAGFDNSFDSRGSLDHSQPTLLLRRVLDAQGKSRAWINGSPATATQLREVGDFLIDIHGQHAWQSLSRSASVRDLLDTYAQLNPRDLSAPWAAWREAQRSLEEATSAQQELARQSERLAWQIGEVDKLEPQADEWEDLNQQHTRLSHAQALVTAVQTAMTALNGAEDAGEFAVSSSARKSSPNTNNNFGDGAVNSVTAAMQALHEQSHIEAEFNTLAEQLGNASVQLEDVAHSLQAWLRKAELEPERLAELDERLGLWVSLSRRYHCPPEELPALWHSWKTELEQLQAQSDLGALQRKEQAAEAAFLQVAQTFSAARQQAAPQLALAVTHALQTLGMAGSRFEIALQSLDKPSAAGLEDTIFLVAGHAGSSARPIAKVASGGELSRIALAIAVCTSMNANALAAGGSGAGTLIFDEVDSGIGGAVADTVGRLMRQLGATHQVLAITHLPQVAARAQQQLKVSKTTSATGIHSQVQLLSADERAQEIARMLGGEQMTATTLAHAQELLSQA